MESLKDDDPIVCMVTCPNQEGAQNLARTLVKEKLAACVNLLAGVRSIYSWKGAIVDDDEVLCLVKTTAGRFDEMRARIVGIHPYEVPEVVALPLSHAHAPYLEWLRHSVGQRGGEPAPADKQGTPG
jgi:periplasmic divalent cation tolerance protein